MGNFIKKMAFISLVIISSNYALSVYADTIFETIKTNQGELKSIEINGRGRLVLNNKVIYKSEVERHISIERYFEKFNVVLINEGPRGSECAGYYRFITLKEDNSVSISRAMGNCASPKVIEQQNKILLKFPAYAYPGETWAYEYGQLHKIGQDFAVTPGVWQQSMDGKSDYIEIGIRDKHGDAHKGKSYDAWFIVTSPDGRIYKAKATVNESDFGDVRFPQDFNFGLDKLKSGIYTWKCLVEGGEVADGRFQYVFPEKPGGFKALDD
jgi:hypothetical protein